MPRLDEIQRGIIQRLEVRGGVARRLMFEKRLLVVEP